MKQQNNIKRLIGIAGMAVIQVFLFLAIVPSFGQQAGQESGIKSLVPGLHSDNHVQFDEKSGDDICTINGIRRYLAGQIQYPETAANSGYSGVVELYARINNEGRVIELLALQPVSDYMEIDEIEVTGYAPPGQEIIESTRHESLLEESKRAVMTLPKCDIQEVYGKTLKFTFNYVLQ